MSRWQQVSAKQPGVWALFGASSCPAIKAIMLNEAWRVSWVGEPAAQLQWRCGCSVAYGFLVR